MHWLFLIDRKWLFLFGSTWLIQPDANNDLFFMKEMIDIRIQEIEHEKLNQPYK